MCLADPRVLDELTKPYSGMAPLERFMREYPCLIGERLGNGDAKNCLERKKAGTEKIEDPPQRSKLG
jgi:hypothetical protein